MDPDVGRLDPDDALAVVRLMERLESSAWHRVADLKPRFRPHADIHRHVYRDQVWHIVQDHQSGRYFRISPAAYHMICQMNGQRSVEDIWAMAGRRWGADRPTQDETIRLMAQLGQADLLVEGAPTDVGALARRANEGRSREMLARIRNPMAIRLPLFDPDRFLSATQLLMRPFFTIWGLIAWALLVATGAVTAVLNWPELTSNVLDRILVAENLILLVAVYPFVKAFHELGHAYAVKVWGGEVHEIGVMFLVFMPVPYVDASSSAAFAEKHQRIVVGAAGILVEVALAAIAMIVWAQAESGLITAIAFNVMLIGGVSTVLFNGNPLLRFDGYYVFADWLEIPNLGPRANKYVLYLIQSRGFGVAEADDPATSAGERRWFGFYALAAFAYRLFIMFAIATFVAGKFFVVGVLLAIWAVSMMLVWPLLKGARFLVSDMRLDGRRGRAFAVTTAALVTVLWVAGGVPLPHRSVTQGVFWAGEEAQVRAGADGFVSELLVTTDAEVDTETLIMRLDEPVARNRQALLEIDLKAARMQFDAVRAIDPVQTRMLSERLALSEERLEAERLRASDREVLAPQDGRLVIPQAATLEGRFVRKGELLGYVLADGVPVVRVVVRQSQIDLVRTRLRGIEVRAASRWDKPVAAKILRAPPAAVVEVPSQTLTTSAGGPIAVVPRENGLPEALEPFFILDVVLEAPLPLGVGERVYVRFDHGTEPILFRLSRGMRRLFLRQFDV